MLLSQPLSELSSLTFNRPIGMDELILLCFIRIKYFNNSNSFVIYEKEIFVDARFDEQCFEISFFLKKIHWKIIFR